MSENEAPGAPEPGQVESADAASAQGKSTEAEWTHRFNLVRKQEFAYLRSVIRRDGSEAAGQTLAGLPVRASSAEGMRGDTLKKIDEVEAQLDVLWLPSHSKTALSGFGVEGPFSGLATSQASGPTTATFASALPDMTKAAASRMHHSELPSSALLIPPLDTTAAKAPGAALVQDQPATLSQQARVPIPCDATVSAAAALFASADYARATQILERALGVAEDRTVRLEQVLALLEIYRVTGNQDQFDSSVLEYFDYWDGKTPQWQAFVKSRPSVSATGEPSFTENTRFDAPPIDDARKLRAHGSISEQYSLDWSSLSKLGAAATDFGQTSIEPAIAWKVSEIHFIGDAFAPVPMPTQSVQGSPWHLSGHVLGANGLGLPDLPDHPTPQRISVSCEALVRMDPEAIAQLLQWLRNASEKKADVHLQDVSVLVGAAWVAAGIDALSQVHLRDLG